MTNRRDFKRRVLYRLDRIDRKCDIILSELHAQRTSRYDAVDDAIDRLHETARSMREQTIRENLILRNRFGI